MATHPRLKVFLVGQVAVERDGVVTDDGCFRGRQGRLLFAYLAAEEGRPVPRDELAEAIWGETPPPSWDKALTVLVSKLRALLAAGEAGSAATLTGAFGCYRLDLPAGAWVDAVDAATASTLAEEALARGDRLAARAAAAQAADIASRAFLPGEDGLWVEEKRRELADVRLRALSTLTDTCLQTGDAAEAVGWAEQVVRLAPFRESAYCRLMQAHIAAGNRAEALQVYERCRRLLADELGAYPSPAIEAVYRELLARSSPDETATEMEPQTEMETESEPAARPLSPTAEPHVRRAGPRAARRGIAATAAVVACAAAGAVLLAARGGSHPTLTTIDSVGLIEASGGHMARIVGVGQPPTSVAVGAGSIWTTNASAGTVSRIDARAGAVRQTIDVGMSPGGIAIGGGGVWVANHDDDTVSWINAQTGALVRTIRVGVGPTAVAYGYGSVWVEADDRTVTRITADTGSVAATIRANAAGRGIAVGGGSVWVTDEVTGSVRGIDPLTDRVSSTTFVGSDPAGIAYADGSLWVANALDDTVSRLDATSLTRETTIRVAGGPSSVVVAHGAVWVGAEFASRVARIDPRRDTVVGWTPTGGRLVVLGDTLDSIDPAMSDSTDSGSLLSTVYDGLVADRRSGGAAGTELVPDLAAALPQPTESGTSYTFHLRRGIRYSDGRPLRAADFRRSLVRNLELDSPRAEDFAHLAGARSCILRRRCDLGASVIVEGRWTLTIRLPAPDPRLLLKLVTLSPLPAGVPLHDIGTAAVPSTGRTRSRATRRGAS